MLRGTRAVRTVQRAHLATRSARPRRNAPAPAVYVDTGLVIATLGRPNVGKSTLFNRLAGAVRGRGAEGRTNPSPLVFVRSVVDPAPGVTRDPRRAAAAVSDLRFHLVDTPGIEAPISANAYSAAALDSVQYAPQRSWTGGADSPGSLVASTALCPDLFYRDMYRVMEANTIRAVSEAHIAMFVIDAADGVTPVDRSIADWLRRHGFSAVPGHEASQRRVLFVANKCDVSDAQSGCEDAFELGFGEPIVISAEHNIGFGDMYNAISDLYEERKTYSEKNSTSFASPPVDLTSSHLPLPPMVPEIQTKIPTVDDAAENDDFDDELVVGVGERRAEEPLRQVIVSIVGRPNVGKSTLLNRLVGREQALVGPAAGVTRDAVLVEWIRPGRSDSSDEIPIWLVDTAGVRAQTKVDDERLERLSVRASIRALRHSHVVVVVLDATEPLSHQDMKIIDLAIAEGRAIVIVVNKMDKVVGDGLEEWRSTLKYRVESKLSSVAGVEVVEMCASEWQQDRSQASRLHGAIQRARRRWEKRVPTSALNRFVSGFNERMSVGGGTDGAKRNRRGVTKFITQKKIRPPMFRLDGSSAVSPNYLRSLTNAIRAEFGFQGVPIRVKRPSRRGRK